MLPRYSQYLRHILRKPEFSQRTIDMLRRDGLLGFFFGDFIRLGRYERDEFNAAVDEEVAGVFGEGEGRGAEDFGDDFLDCGWVGISMRV